MTTTFDVAIIGAGPAGIFAATKLALDHKNVKAILFDLGRPCGKRRRPGEGYFGMFPSSDGKLFMNDIKAISDISGTTNAKKAFKWISGLHRKDASFSVTKDTSPQNSLIKKIKKCGFNIDINNHIQLYPQDIHIISKYTSDIINESKNITCSFDNEIFSVTKHKNQFHIESYLGNFVCKKLIMCVGRSGWRWTQEIFQTFGIIEENNTTKFGVRIEMPADNLKDFNQSNCKIYNDELEIGPFSWNGTVVPEDHLDFSISAFRGNEDRWKTDNVSFNLIGNRTFENRGFEQTDRLGQLTFILANDRVAKERTNLITSGKSKLSILPEYGWLADALQKVSQFVPELIMKGYMHFPTLIPTVSKINLGSNFLTDVPGMFCAGESAGTSGLLFAMLSGTIAADAISRK